MDEEICTSEKNQTLESVKLPHGKKLIGCKWVFTIKYKPNDMIERYKVKLVAKRFTQTYEIDYLETFVPIAKMNTVKILLSLSSQYN